MSLVAEGPEIMVIGAVASTRASASGKSSTTESSGTMHTWWSGTRVIARRPSSGRPLRKIVPVSAQETVEDVTTASTSFSASTLRGSRSPSWAPRTAARSPVWPTAGSVMRSRPAPRESAGSQSDSRPAGTTYRASGPSSSAMAAATVCSVSSRTEAR